MVLRIVIILFLLVPSAAFSMVHYSSNKRTSHFDILQKACKDRNPKYFVPYEDFTGLCYIFGLRDAMPTATSVFRLVDINWHIKQKSTDKGVYESERVLRIVKNNNILPAYKYVSRRVRGEVVVFVTNDERKIAEFTKKIDEKTTQTGDKIKYIADNIYYYMNQEPRYALYDIDKSYGYHIAYMNVENKAFIIIYAENMPNTSMVEDIIKKIDYSKF